MSSGRPQTWWHRWMTIDERDGESLALIVGCGIAAVIVLVVIS